MRYAAAILNAQLDAVTARLAGGTLTLYDGDAPTTPDDPARRQTRLAMIRFPSPAFNPAASGEAIARPMVPDPDAAGTGTATWFRCTGADGSVVCDGTVGKSETADLVMKATSIQQGAEVYVSAFVLTTGAMR